VKPGAKNEVVKKKFGFFAKSSKRHLCDFLLTCSLLAFCLFGFEQGHQHCIVTLSRQAGPISEASII